MDGEQSLEMLRDETQRSVVSAVSQEESNYCVEQVTQSMAGISEKIFARAMNQIPV